MLPKLQQGLSAGRGDLSRNARGEEETGQWVCGKKNENIDPVPVRVLLREEEKLALEG